MNAVCHTAKPFPEHRIPQTGPGPYSLGNGVNSTADLLVTLLGSSSTRWYSKMVLRRDSERETEPDVRA